MTDPTAPHSRPARLAAAFLIGFAAVVAGCLAIPAAHQAWCPNGHFQRIEVPPALLLAPAIGADGRIRLRSVVVPGGFEFEWVCDEHRGAGR